MALPVSALPRFVRAGIIMVVSPLVTAAEHARNSILDHVDKINQLSCGLMIGSAVFLPSLSSSTLGLRRLYLIDFGIYFFSVIPYVWLNRADIIENGQYGLVPIVIIATLIFLSPGFSAKEFRPYVPISVSMGILVIVYVVPWVRKAIQPAGNLTAENLSIFANGNTFGLSDGASIDPNSRNSTLEHDQRRRLFFPRGQNPQDFAHIGSFHGGHQMLRMPQPPGDDNDIDLEAGYEQDSASSTESRGIRDPLLRT